MGKIVTDNIEYAKSVQFMSTRDRAADLDFSGILTEEAEASLKEAAIISMGTEISDQDVDHVKALADQVVSLSEYRAQLYDYLKSRMAAIAPNLTVLVGELVGARLISHAGSLMNLAKQPASTVQILGAEKALFRALKTKHDTPKYGLIYHASLVGQAEPKHKGKISRVLAAKCALSIRVDALGETSEPTVGYEGRLKVEERLRQLQGKAPIPKEEVKLAVKQPKVAMAADAKVGGYSTAGDAVLDGKKAKKEKKEKAEAGDDEAAKKEAKKAAAAAAGETGDAEASEKKKKKRDKDDDEDDEEKPKKKKKSKE